MKEEKPIGMMVHCLSHQIHREVDKAIKENDEDETGRNNGWIIRYLVDHQDVDVYQKDLEKAFSLTRSTVSKVVDLMVKKGLVIRTPVEKDARLKKLTLTPIALKKDQQIKEGIDQFETKLVQGFSEEELKRLQEYLRRLEYNIDERNDEDK